MFLLSSAAINRVNTIHIRDNINRMLYVLPNFSNPDHWRRLRQHAAGVCTDDCALFDRLLWAQCPDGKTCCAKNDYK